MMTVSMMIVIASPRAYIYIYICTLYRNIFLISPDSYPAQFFVSCGFFVRFSLTKYCVIFSTINNYHCDEDTFHHNSEEYTSYNIAI